MVATKPKRINFGKIFEQNVKASSTKEGIFFYRIKDSASFQATSKNDFDSFMYHHPNLFALELKSTKARSLPLQNIKGHQIEKLIEAGSFNGIIAGFLINFRNKENEYDSTTYFLHIDDFTKYIATINSDKLMASHSYCVKPNKKSIPFKIVDEVGIKVEQKMKKVHPHYFMGTLITDIKRNKLKVNTADKV